MGNGQRITMLERRYLPQLAELIDRLSIVTLKSIKLGCNDLEKKEVYEKEADLIMYDINLLLQEKKDIVIDWGKLIRGIQLDMLANEVIWVNETIARQGEREQDKLLPFTHSVNAVRMFGGNMIVNQTGEQKDLNSDRLNHNITIQRGYNFSGCFRNI